MLYYVVPLYLCGFFEANVDPPSDFFQTRFTYNYIGVPLRKVKVFGVSAGVILEPEFIFFDPHHCNFLCPHGVNSDLFPLFLYSS